MRWCPRVRRATKKCLPWNAGISAHVDVKFQMNFAEATLLKQAQKVALGVVRDRAFGKFLEGVWKLGCPPSVQE